MAKAKATPGKKAIAKKAAVKKAVAKKAVAKKAAPLKKGAVAAAATAVPPKLKVMVSSSVYHRVEEVHQLCGQLKTYGYEVLNSEIGTIYPPLNSADITLKACLDAVDECDIFLGIISPFYGTSGFTHKEFTRAIQLDKPRRFICHKNVTFSRQLLKPFRFKKANNGRTVKTDFKIVKTEVMDDIRVIDMYEASVQSHLPPADWKYRWVQEYFYFNEALDHIRILFGDRKRVEADLASYNNI